MHLQDIQSPQDLQGLSYEELERLAAEIRNEIISTVSERGGHLASNLGVVELTLALHRAFHMPEDKIIFDVGHQCYVHKLLTGRYPEFHTLRTYRGMAGFPKRAESPYDIFETGHSSTAISAALGMARARDLQGQNYQVVAVVGDGALTGGMCYEALNDGGSTNTRMIVVLNDNEMSISQNVGALSEHLTNLRVSHGWISTKRHVRSRTAKIPVVGKHIYRFLRWARNTIKSLFVDESFFHLMGFRYYGPVDGHDIRSLEHIFSMARDFDKPAVIHVLTKKGKGWRYSEEQPDKFHGIGPFDPATGEVKSKPACASFGSIVAERLQQMAAEDPRIVAISAAMIGGTGLTAFQKAYPERTFDVGITEEHAVTMAAGMAAAGLKPYFAVYTSFFQRSYDQMIHDVAMQKLPVTFLLDRAGLVGDDGQTHHGILDLASMLPVPNMTVLAPCDIHELAEMIPWTQSFEGPVAIRYGRQGIDLTDTVQRKPFAFGRWQKLTSGQDLTILAMGSMVREALTVRTLLEQRGIQAAVVNCSTVKPLDEVMLRSLDRAPFVTMEEHMLLGGFGASVTQWCQLHGQRVPLLMFGIQDTFVPHGTREQLMTQLGLSPEQMAKKIGQALGGENRG